MPFLFLFSMFVLEIYVFAKVWSHFGFINMMFGLLAGAILGIGIAKNQGKYVISQLQQSVSRGQMPSTKVIHGLLVFIGGIFLAVPGFVSDIFGLLLIIPGPRHLFVSFVKFQIQAKLFGKGLGAFKIFTYGMGGMGQQRPHSRPHDSGAPKEGWERDVSPKVIDVKPVISETHRKREQD